MDRATLASLIDQTLLKPTVGLAEAREWMSMQRGRGFASLCVSPFLVPAAVEVLSGVETRVCTVVAFPLGYAMTVTKADEAARLVAAGAQEIDMVLNIAQLIAGDHGFVRHDIEAVVEAVERESGGEGIVKVILETGHLTPDMIAAGSRLTADAGADFVKTSTGFGPRGGSVEDVVTMKKAAGPGMGIKAAGGIRDLPTALALIEAGATRIGTSAGIEIVTALVDGPSAEGTDS